MPDNTNGTRKQISFITVGLTIAFAIFSCGFAFASVKSTAEHNKEDIKEMKDDIKHIKTVVDGLAKR